jgi:hypothetical protein
MKKAVPPELLPPPQLPVHLSGKAQWLAGEGCGSWFVIEQEEEAYAITRYSPEGEIECSGLFVKESTAVFNIFQPYKITYLSHCSQVSVVQNGIMIRLRKKFIT